MFTDLRENELETFKNHILKMKQAVEESDDPFFEEMEEIDVDRYMVAKYDEDGKSFEGVYWDTFMVASTLREYVENEFTFYKEGQDWFTKSSEILDDETLSEEERERRLEAHRETSPFTEENYKSDIGVADNVEQIVEHYSYLNDDPRRFIILLRWIPKVDEQGGWRWHKNGPYIGTKEPQYEYLAEEGDEFNDGVLTFHLIQMKP